MKAKRLTDVSVERIKATDKREEYPDTLQPGLRLIVQATGKKSWAVRARLNGKSFKYTIPGAYPTIDLPEARRLAKQAILSAIGGDHPAEVERQRREEEAAKKRKALDQEQRTLRALCEAYADHLKARGKKGAETSARSGFRCHVYPGEAANKPAREVTSEEIAAIVRKVREAGKERAAGLLRANLKAAYSAAMRAPYDSSIPSDLIAFGIKSNPVDPIPAIKVKAGTRHLSWDEIGTYYAALADTRGIVSQALQVALLGGGQRIAQVLRATINDWEPKSRALSLYDSKGRRQSPRPHLVPLGPVVAEIIDGLVTRAKEKGTQLLFSSAIGAMPIDPGTPGDTVSEIAAAMALCSRLQSEKFDLRDIRRTVETLLASIGISKDVRAQLQSHGLGGVQAQHYDKWDYIEEKRAAVLAWEGRLEALLSGSEPASNVVPLRA